MPELEPEILVNISFRLPAMAAMDRAAWTDQMLDVIREALLIGGPTIHVGIQPYTPEED